MRDDEYILSLCDELLGMTSERTRTFAFIRGAGYCARAEALYTRLKLMIEYQEDQRGEPVLPKGMTTLVLSYADFDHTEDKRLRRQPARDRAVLFAKLHAFIPDFVHATAH